MISKSPQFQFWSITLELELTLLKCVQSLRQGDFQLYVDSLVNLVPWFFALGHIHYSRWVPVHIRDMTGLHVSHPNVATKFQNGHFFVKKTLNAFSSLPIDHAHEQNNESVKGDRGAIGLSENMSELLRWMVAGPEIALLILEFEASQECIKADRDQEPNKLHHEQAIGVQACLCFMLSHDMIRHLALVKEE